MAPMDRRRFLATACTAAGLAVTGTGTGSAADDGRLTVELVRHASRGRSDRAMAAAREGVDLFAETWGDATPGTADVTTETSDSAAFELSASHVATLNAIEEGWLRSGRTAETVTLFVVSDGSTTAGAMRSYAGDDGHGGGEPGAYGYVNTELVDFLGVGLGTPAELIRNFAAHECGHAVLGWADFPHYPADATERDPSPAHRAHSCGAQDHPAASGWFVRHGITPMATGYSAIESHNTPRDHKFATERGPIDGYADPVDDSWFSFNMDYVPAFSETARAAMGHHYRQYLA